MVLFFKESLPKQQLATEFPTLKFQALLKKWNFHRRSHLDIEIWQGLWIKGNVNNERKHLGRVQFEPTPVNNMHTKYSQINVCHMNFQPCGVHQRYPYILFKVILDKLESTQKQNRNLQVFHLWTKLRQGPRLESSQFVGWISGFFFTYRPWSNVDLAFSVAEILLRDGQVDLLSAPAAGKPATTPTGKQRPAKPGVRGPLEHWCYRSLVFFIFKKQPSLLKQLHPFGNSS